MDAPDDVLRGIGAIAAHSAWLEVTAASIVVRRLDDAVSLAGQPGRALREARTLADQVDDTALGSEIREWVKEAQSLLDASRHPIVHGLLHHDENDNWHSLHPRSGALHALDPSDLERRAIELEDHTVRGLELAWRRWGIPGADFLRTEERP